MMSTWLPSSALSAGAPLWNGTPVAFVFKSTLRTYSLPMRADEPPNPKLNGLSLCAATNSDSVFSGMAGIDGERHAVARRKGDRGELVDRIAGILVIGLVDRKAVAGHQHRVAI